jgi:uncharacterized protein YceH (UPF0502 family)
MQFTLDPVEARVLGCLLEKELATPDGYPLSLVALTAACNQKTSREPVMNLDEATVLDALNALMKKHLVRDRGGAGSRVSKYAHRLAGNLDPADDFSTPQRALLGLLMLRGPQTVGELRTRSGRMVDFQSLDEVEQTLGELAARADGPYTAEVPRQPGQRERRFMHLWSGDEIPEVAAQPSHPPGQADTLDRLLALEDEVTALRKELAALQAQVTDLLVRRGNEPEDR